MFAFDAGAYGPEVDSILALGGPGNRPMPLAGGGCTPAEVRARLGTTLARDLFAGAPAPEAAMAGLWLYFSCYDEAHKIAQDIHTAEGSFWHAIMHRRDPDPGNAAYWFRQVGSHPIFPRLLEYVEELQSASGRALLKLGATWDPLAFIDFCETARQKPGSKEEKFAIDVQLAEWQLLFDWCARRSS